MPSGTLPSHPGHWTHVVLHDRSSDIPLAADLIDKEVAVISPRGENFTKDTIKQKLVLRDFMETMRSSGEHSGRSKPLAKTDLQKFANALDRYITKHKNI